MKRMNSIESIVDLIKWNNDNSKDEKRFLFRGMPDKSFSLIPKISRNQIHKGEAVDENAANKRIVKLREYLNLRLPAYNIDLHNLQPKHKAWREVMIAQHFGVPTHLLDFTRNPMAALFFAINKKEEKDGSLWAIRIAKNMSEWENIVYNDPSYNIASYDLISGENTGFTPYEFLNPFFVVPPQFDGRIKTQDSVFCCFPKGKGLTTPLEVQFKDIKKDFPNHLQSWSIPAISKRVIMEELNRIGINYASLFPDLYGFGEFVNWKLNTLTE